MQVSPKEIKKRRKPFLRQFYRNNRLCFALGIVDVILMSVASLAVAWLLQTLIDLSIGADTRFTLMQLLWIFLGGLGVIILSYAISHWANPRFFSRAMSQYKNYVFEEITKKNISAFNSENTSVYISALSNDANTIESDYLVSLYNMVTYILLFVGAFTMMLLYSPLLTLIAVVLTLLPVVASLLAGNKAAEAETKVSEQNEAFMSTLKDSLTGFSVIKSFRAEAAMCRMFAENVRRVESAKGMRRKINILVESLGAVAGVIAQIGIFFIGIVMAMNNMGVSAGMIMAFVQLMNYVIGPVAELPKIFAGRKAAFALIDKLADALSGNLREQGADVPKTLTRGIEVKDLSFGYEEDKQVLHDLNIHFEPGKSYALVGASGSGKSTLLNLLMASYSNYSGSILIDGQELQTVSSSSLYELVSIIQQNVFVFNASIRDNITMFSPFPKEEVDRVIELSGLSALIAERGEDYLCGENGVGLSGGEKQRISIARSLLRRSSVLLVDEATAALDAQTAFQVSSSILGLDGMTRIVVTHALDEELLRRYDHILAMKNGMITEAGTFQELIDRKGYFYSLFTISQ